jgi:hypothetical protein
MAMNRTPWLIGIVVFMHHAAFSALDPTVLPVSYGQYGGSVAVGPQNTLLTWIDYRRTEDMAHEVFGTRIGPLGETLDGDGIPLTGLADGGAAVAALRNQFLIVWSKGPDIYARRMTSSGELLDTQSITVTANPGHPYPELVYREFTAAADGVNFWVAWNDDRSMPAGTPEYLRYDYEDIYAARINPAGRVLDPRGIRICTRRGGQRAPRLSSRADFIVWSDYRGGKHSIFGARLHPKGFSLDANGFAIMSSTNLYTTAADVSGNGRAWLVVWGDPSAIYGAQVSPKPAVSRQLLLAGTIERATPQVEASGQDYLVLWQADASTVGTRVTATKQVGPIVTIASDPTGTAYYSFGGFAGDGVRYYVTGTTAPKSSSWFYNDVWFGSFTRSMLP